MKNLLFIIFVVGLAISSCQTQKKETTADMENPFFVEWNTPFGVPPFAEIEVEHFQSWIDWCKEQGIGMDFNASCFSHPRAADGYTLSSKNEENPFSNYIFVISRIQDCHNKKFRCMYLAQFGSCISLRA